MEYPLYMVCILIHIYFLQAKEELDFAGSLNLERRKEGHDLFNEAL